MKTFLIVVVSFALGCWTMWNLEFNPSYEDALRACDVEVGLQKLLVDQCLNPSDEDSEETDWQAFFDEYYPEE